MVPRCDSKIHYFSIKLCRLQHMENLLQSERKLSSEKMTSRTRNVVQSIISFSGSDFKAGKTARRTWKGLEITIFFKWQPDTASLFDCGGESLLFRFLLMKKLLIEFDCDLAMTWVWSGVMWSCFEFDKVYCEGNFIVFARMQKSRTGMLMWLFYCWIRRYLEAMKLRFWLKWGSEGCHKCLLDNLLDWKLLKSARDCGCFCLPGCWRENSVQRAHAGGAFSPRFEPIFLNPSLFQHLGW